MNTFLGTLAFILFISIEQALSRVSLVTERETLSAILKEYDPTVRAGGLNETGPVVVEVNTFIRHIGDIDDDKMLLDGQFTLRQTWTDQRLKYDVKDLKYITLTEPEKIWLPDLFFSNEEYGRTHDILKPNVLIRIYPDGRVLYSTRISLRLYCHMNLKHYPLDKQVCNIHLASYSYAMEDVYFIWKLDGAVQITKHLNLRKFKLNIVGQDYCTAKTPTGDYSCLKLELHFSRYLYHYLQTTYFPTIALVLMSWIIFWINPNYSNIRFGLWIGILTCMIIVATSVNLKAPETPYSKALDIWVGVCSSFIFLVLIELSVVSSVVAKSDACLKENRLTNVIESTSSQVEDLRMRNRLRKYISEPLKWFKNRITKAQRIDFVFRVLFPVMFIAFNVSYWITFSEKERVCDSDNCTLLLEE